MRWVHCRPLVISLAMLLPEHTLPSPEAALAGRPEVMTVPEPHCVLETPLSPPWPEGLAEAFFGMGCFWGAERLFWNVAGMYTTAVGYAGGLTPNPTYHEVCTGRTGHAEIVRTVFDPSRVSYEELLRRFWENHDPTQGMRQGNDVGTQYRSAIYTVGADQHETALRTRDAYAEGLRTGGYDAITTEIRNAPNFYYAEEHHQQYLAKNPGGYCDIGGTGISCPAALQT